MSRQVGHDLLGVVERELRNRDVPDHRLDVPTKVPPVCVAVLLRDVGRPPLVARHLGPPSPIGSEMSGLLTTLRPSRRDRKLP